MVQTKTCGLVHVLTHSLNIYTIQNNATGNCLYRVGWASSSASYGYEAPVSMNYTGPCSKEGKLSCCVCKQQSARATISDNSVIHML